MRKMVLAVSILAVAATCAAAKDTRAVSANIDGSTPRQPTIELRSGPWLAQAAGSRELDANAILRSLAPIEYLPEHSGRKRSVDLEIRFKINSASLTAAAERQIRELAAALRAPRMRGAPIRIAGHTDASGSARYNKALSARRAAAVKRHLVRRHGLDPARIETVGWGEERLKNPISPESAANRRVEVIALTPPARAGDAAPATGRGFKKIDF